MIPRKRDAPPIKRPMRNITCELRDYCYRPLCTPFALLTADRVALRDS